MRALGQLEFFLICLRPHVTFWSPAPQMAFFAVRLQETHSGGFPLLMPRGGQAYDFPLPGDYHYAVFLRLPESV